MVGLEFRCIVCGRVFGSAQGLRGHVKVHRGEYVRFEFLVPRSTRDAFKVVCRAHGLSTCHMLVSFMDAVVDAFRRGGVVEFDPRTEVLRARGGGNPIHISITQHFLGKPRSAWKLPLSRKLREVELQCEVCGGPAEFLHFRGVATRVAYMALCEEHHRGTLRLGLSRGFIELRNVNVRRAW